MLSNYRLHKIKELLNDFTKITGQRIGLLDTECNDIFISVEHCEFCSLMRSNPKGLKRCLECDMNAMEEAKRKRKLIIYRCHAGLIEACAPIYDDSELLGFIFLGQMLYKNNYEEQRANAELLASDIIEDYTIFSNAFSKIQRLDKDYLIAAANIMLSCTRFIIYEQLLKYEKSDLWFKINEYLHNNYDKNFSLEKISSDLSISVPMLCKTAKQKSNQTIGELVTKMKIDKAKYFLENSKMPISEVARSIGYDDYSYFSRVFKKSTGFSPNAWRKNIQKLHN